MVTLIKSFTLGSLLAVLFIVVSTQITQFNQHWYTAEFKRLSIEPPAGQIENLFGYLQNRHPLENKFYTEREILHLKDIKQLLAQEFLATIVACVVMGVIVGLFVITRRFSELFKTLFFGSIITIILYGGTLLIFYFYFDWLFLYFHQLLFSNDYWQLDPNVDHLITIFPPKLFFDLAQQITALALLSTVTVFIGSGLVVTGMAIQKSR